MSKNHCTYLNLTNTLLLKKMANHDLSLQRVIIYLLVESLKYCENYQNVSQRKMELTDLLDAGLPQTSNL